MRRLLLVIACLVAIGCAEAVAADTPTAPRIAESCPMLASFASIECRASELLRVMQSAAELGTLDSVSPTIALRAEVAIANAELTCESGSSKHSRSSASLGRLVQILDRLRGRLVARSRRRQLDAADRDLYLAVILPLRDDVRALRQQLVCPGHSEQNVCGDGIPQAGFAGGPGGEECDDGNTKDGDGCSAQCRIEPTIEDFSGFGSFAFDRESAFGFCPPAGGLFAAAIANDAAGVTTLRWSILRDDVDCGEPPFQCTDVDRFARALTSVEVEQARAAFHAVSLIESTPNGCGTIAIDPCLVNAFRWDDFAARDFLCRAPLVPADEANRIVAVLTGLAHCDGDCSDGAGAGGGAEYQCLEEGDPGVPDDGVVVRDHFGPFTLARPFSLQSVTHGLTVTAYLPGTEATDHVLFQANFDSLGRPGNVCSVGISADGSTGTLAVRPDGGLALDITQAALERGVEVLRTAPGQNCSDVHTVADLSFASFYLVRVLTPPPGFQTEAITQVDALAIGVGDGVTPTADTPPPLCPSSP